MKTHIQDALNALVGKPLWSSGRSAGLQWFSFGERQSVTGVRGNVKEVGEYALHIQCAWRIIRHDEVIVASGDVYAEPRKKPSRELHLKFTLLDERVQELFQGEARRFAVEKVEAADAGAFCISFSDGYALNVMPDDSSDDEHWRLFKPYTEGPHFVVTGVGLDT
ncbi:MAG TPA: hypothetical protein VMU24_07935 [Candidatus Acidoferrales bacterium]|nr:hypothetical protein [Candidatus Acidoferrales bacterium]